MVFSFEEACAISDDAEENSMDVEFADQMLERLEREFQFSGGFSAEIVKAYRKRMQLIRNAVDERDFY